MAARTDPDDRHEMPAPAPEGPSCPGAPAPQADLRRPGAAPAALKPEDLRILLKHLNTPHRLDTPEIRALLAAHRRLPPNASPTSVGAVAARLLTDSIARLEAPVGATPAQQVPHRVLDICFVRGRKGVQAAAELGLSMRQLTRERTRALQLLAAELAAPATLGLAAEPLPAIEGHLRRDALLRRLSEAAATHRLVGVIGAAGVGKTALVATLAHALDREGVWWHRIRSGINDTLEAVLFELGHALAREGSAELRDYLAASAAAPNLSVATRLALSGLACRPRVLIVDDFDSAREPKDIESWLEEVVERLPLVSVVTIGGVVAEAEVVEVPAFTRVETAEFLRRLRASPEVVSEIHGLSHGNTRMVAAIAAWWTGEKRALQVLRRHLEGRGLQANLADLTARVRLGA